MELRQALEQIDEIRSVVARSETFRGYRSVTVGISGVSAILAAGLQSWLLPKPIENLRGYLTLWVSVAAANVALVAWHLVMRCRRTRSAWLADQTWLAAERFLPCLVAAALVTAAIVRLAAESAWLLPGVWCAFFSLGIFASSSLLPRSSNLIGMFYLMGAACCLILARGEAALSPWAMASTFGCGQLLTAAVLYFTLERHDGR